MFLRVAKILALGAGAVITTGIPSGTIVHAPEESQQVKISESFSLQEAYSAWTLDNGPVAVLQKISPNSVITIGGTEQPLAKVKEAPAPSRMPTMNFRPAWKKPIETRSSERKPLILPKVRVSLPSLAPRAYQVDSPSARSWDAPDWDHGWSDATFRCYAAADNAEDYLTAATSRLSTLLPDQERDWDVPTAAAKTAAKSAAPKPSGSDGAPALVPEPSGLFALLAGLPGLGMLVRFRKNRR